MASTFLSMLGELPWGTIIDQAPHVAEKATSLLDRFRPESRESEAAPADASLTSRIEAQAAEIGRLRLELSEAAQLIAVLSQAQEGLVGRLRRVRRLVLAALGVAAAAALAAGAALLV